MVRIRFIQTLLFALGLLVAAAGTAAWAQDDEDDLFGGPIVEEDDSQSDSGEETDGDGSDDGDDGSEGGTSVSDTDYSQEMLSGEPVRIGGRYRFSVAPSFFWDELDSPRDISGWADYSVETTLGTQFFLDARPSSDFRVYAEADVSYPFTVSPASGAEPAREFSDIVRITELFSDFTVADALFLRTGKHTVTWGVGYFFSPADIINLERIDPEEPEADREGPVNVKAQLPVGTTNLYLYALPPVRGETYPAFAPKAELVVGTFELGAGGYWRHRDDSGRVAENFAGMLTVEGTLSDFKLFGEAVLLGGNDRTYVREVSPLENPLGVETYERDEAVFSATAGASYRSTDVETDTGINVSAQYLYNGGGYEDPSVLADNRTGVQALVVAGALAPSDLSRTGRHYGAVSAGVTSILGTDLSLQGLWYANLSDGSGRLSSTLSYRFTERLSASAGASWLYGDEGYEYTPAGQRVGFDVNLDIGSGSF